MLLNSRRVLDSSRRICEEPYRKNELLWRKDSSHHDSEEGQGTKWSGKHYAQIRGLAMGQRLAPTLAVAFMSKVEAQVIDFEPLLYYRYIDNCFETDFP
uniref:Reverse transcriptase domain-containing protein n=1 Tax=Angiostrongylus cantonensis TaxID=6313 RepID=A0A0K0CVI6_ANGCA